MNDIPDVEISGTVYKMICETDKQGFVLVAYSRDADGRIGRSFLRFGQAGADYIRRRLDDADEIRRESAAAVVREVQA
ncbi:hypothetical protein [Streptomyces xanthochromogenes]